MGACSGDAGAGWLARGARLISALPSRLCTVYSEYVVPSPTQVVPSPSLMRFYLKYQDAKPTPSALDPAFETLP